MGYVRGGFCWGIVFRGGGLSCIPAPQSAVVVINGCLWTLYITFIECSTCLSLSDLYVSRCGIDPGGRVCPNPYGMRITIPLYYDVWIIFMLPTIHRPFCRILVFPGADYSVRSQDGCRLGMAASSRWLLPWPMYTASVMTFDVRYYVTECRT